MKTEPVSEQSWFVEQKNLIINTIKGGRSTWRCVRCHLNYFSFDLFDGGGGAVSAVDPWHEAWLRLVGFASLWPTAPARSHLSLMGYSDPYVGLVLLSRLGTRCAGSFDGTESTRHLQLNIF